MTKEKVEILLKENNLTWKEFQEFSLGDTIGINKDGSYDYYETDVNKFLRSKGRIESAFRV